jgi:hypothetical protein
MTKVHIQKRVMNNPDACENVKNPYCERTQETHVDLFKTTASQREEVVRAASTATPIVNLEKVWVDVNTVLTL